MARHIGRIAISEELLLSLLQFQGGHVLLARMNPNTPAVIDLFIEHPDMPFEVGENQEAPIVNVVYSSHFGANGQLLSISRVRDEATE